MKTSTSSIHPFLLLIAMAAPATAATMITPSGAVSSSTAITNGGLVETYNGISIGVTSDGLVVNEAQFTPGDTITYTIPTPSAIDTFYLWNDVGTGTGQGINSFSLEFFDGGSSLGSFAGNAAAETSTPANAPEQTFSVGSFTDVTSVVLTINSLHDNPSFNNDLQFREVAFGTVPEPSSCTLLGLAGLVLLRRRR